MSDEKKLHTGGELENDRESLVEEGLRPAGFSEFIGQERVVENLRAAMAGARKRTEPLDHVLLAGGPGLGKTTLARILAKELSVNIYETTGPALEKSGDLVGLLTKLQEGDVLFIDEIHRLKAVVEEHLYAAMEDYRIDIVLDQGPAARSLKIPLKKFSLVGATTREALLQKPFRDRFKILERLDDYSEEQIQDIVRRTARILSIEMDETAVFEAARRARRTPRVAIRLVRRMADYAALDKKELVDGEVAQRTFQMLQIDGVGLERIHIDILRYLSKNPELPIGLKTLAIAVNEPDDSVEDVYEPYLIRLGYLVKTSRGRQITALGLKHLGTPTTGQGQIF